MKYAYIIILLLSFVNCTGQKKSEVGGTVTEKSPEFTMVSIPTVLTEPGERAEYLVIHYWDNFNFSDVRYISLPEITEQAFVDYIDVLPHTKYEVSVKSIQNMLSKAEADSSMYFYFAELFEKYLHDPNSPFRNEELYIPVLESIVETSLIDDAYKIRPLYQLELARKNRIGEVAADFIYTRANGRKQKMHGLSANYLLLYFYNPDCHSCKEITADLSGSSIVKKALEEDKLKILAVYPDDDLTAWKNNLDHMPGDWINAYDEGTKVKDEEIYDLKAIPTLYLLDKDKKVILKDTTFDEFTVYLQNNLMKK